MAFPQHNSLKKNKNRKEGEGKDFDFNLLPTKTNEGTFLRRSWKNGSKV